MSDRWKGLLDFAGLLLLAMSLTFVAYQMQQDRKIALAQLNAASLQLMATRMASGMESDAYLGMWSKLWPSRSWNVDGLDEHEVAAAELDAVIWLLYFEMEFERYREGLMSEQAWSELNGEIAAFISIPHVSAMYDTWWRRPIPSEFTRAVDQALKRAQ